MIWLLIPIVVIILLRDKTSHPAAINTESTYYTAALIDYPLERNKTFRYTARLNTGETVYLYFAKDSLRPLPVAGDSVVVLTRLKEGGILGDFDYGKYLRRQGISGNGYVGRKDWQKIGHRDISGPILWQHRLVERYKQVGIDAQVLPVLSAITLGYKEDLDDTVRRRFQRSGAAHVLAVSGLHTGLIAALIIGLLTLWGWYRPLYEERWRRILNSLVLIAGIWLYAAMTGLTPSVVRSAIMVTLAAVAYMFYRKPLGLNTLAAAAIAILLIRPNDLFSVSFQMSFAAVAGIIISLPLMKLELPQGGLDRGIIYVRGIIQISIAAQFAVLPLTLHYFSQTSNYFILTNLGVLPLAQIAVYLAVAVLALGTIPFVGPALVWCENMVINIMLRYTGWIENLPGAVTERTITPVMAIVLYAIMIAGLIILKIIRR
jgi:competence protein ComEC